MPYSNYFVALLVYLINRLIYYIFLCCSIFLWVTQESNLGRMKIELIYKGSVRAGSFIGREAFPLPHLLSRGLHHSWVKGKGDVICLKLHDNGGGTRTKNGWFHFPSYPSHWIVRGTMWQKNNVACRTSRNDLKGFSLTKNYRFLILLQGLRSFLPHSSICMPSPTAGHLRLFQCNWTSWIGTFVSLQQQSPTSKIAGNYWVEMKWAKSWISCIVFKIPFFLFLLLNLF